MKIFNIFKPRIAVYGKESGKLLYITKVFWSLAKAREYYQNTKAISRGKARLVDLNPVLNLVELKPFEKAVTHIFTR